MTDAAAAGMVGAGVAGPTTADDDAITSASPMRVATEPGFGRFYVAARTIQPGELLFATPTPDASVVREGLVDHVCANCFAISDGASLPVVCTGCRYLAFCSEECRSCTATLHEAAECRAFGRLREKSPPIRMDLTTLRLALQVLYRRRRGSKSRGDGGNCEELHTGIESFSAQQNWPERRGRYRKIATAFAYACADDFEWSLEELQDVLGSIECNAFDLWKANRKRKLGLGLYVAGSLFNHSCAPNVAKVQRGSRIEFYSLAAVRSQKELCIAYIDPRIPDVQRRRSELAAGYGFFCKCERCEDGQAKPPPCCPRHLGYLVPAEDGGTWCTVCGGG
eukprot:TRINITY_DN29470_c0_g1_i1.p1 TRINITY_DN29470_c0_g1~~TRINITY_DN29470_c0_g1_i1.p1  ORF type:complete len:386 (-),score=53.55 TRINITY_DN29470_c0_g1_i1:76-1086(-)